MATPPSTRAAGLHRLAAFLPAAGSSYAARRNYDPGPGGQVAVSGLSPWIRHRLVTEPEVLGGVLAHHAPAAADKFVQEVLWRTYWKGWLELRPAVYRDYRANLAACLERLDADPVLAERYRAAVGGRTGIACFDHWCGELIATGGLHNHARMWFASIWCFTLDLPWPLGADFFLRHLIDGDAASNTLSWRWVAGLHTRGKHYIARAENIARYTEGRFNPVGQLNEAPAPLEAPPHPPITPLAALAPPPAGPAVLLLHEDDLGVDSLDLPAALSVVAITALAAPEERSPLGCSALVSDWVRGAARDALRAAERRFGAPARLIAEPDLAGLVTESGASVVVTPAAPCGWTADRLTRADAALGARGAGLIPFRRPYDTQLWPLARGGYFDFKKAADGVIRTML